VWPVAVVILVVVLKGVPVIERGGVGMAEMHDGKLPGAAGNPFRPSPSRSSGIRTFVARSPADFSHHES
jgi:hypothetical protein